MQLLGSLNWWAPGPLHRLHERCGVREIVPPVVQLPAGWRGRRKVPD
jgi:hypothetical protein